MSYTAFKIYIIYTVNEYISGKLLLTGLHVYNTHQEHPQGHTLPIIIEATKKQASYKSQIYFINHLTSSHPEIPSSFSEEFNFHKGYNPKNTTNTASVNSRFPYKVYMYLTTECPILLCIRHFTK